MNDNTTHVSDPPIIPPAQKRVYVKVETERIMVVHYDCDQTRSELLGTILPEYGVVREEYKSEMYFIFYVYGTFYVVDVAEFVNRSMNSRVEEK